MVPRGVASANATTGVVGAGSRQRPLREVRPAQPAVTAARRASSVRGTSFPFTSTVGVPVTPAFEAASVTDLVQLAYRWPCTQDANASPAPAWLPSATSWSSGSPVEFSGGWLA